MANLVPLSNSSLVKTQKSSAITAGKFLRTRTGTVRANNIAGSSGNILKKIEGQVIQIDKILKDTLLLSKKENERKRTTKEEKSFEEREKDLEKKVPKPEGKGIKLPSAPKLGIFGWLKNFITQTILGFFAVRFIDLLPQLLRIVPVIINVSDFIVDIGGKMLDGLITFVDWGYKAIDGTREFMKSVGGEGLAQNFDKFTGALSGLLDAAIIAAIAVGGMGGDDRGGGGSKSPDVGNRTRRNILQRGARRAFVGTLGKGGAKAVLKFVRPFTKRLPIIGGLLDFGLSLALGEDPGRAAFKAIGATLLGAIGAALGGPFAPLTGFAGGFAGDMAGGALYDLFFGNKKPEGKTIKAAGGGKPTTRGGKPVSGPGKRTITKKKAPRTLTATPPRLKPGSSVGGEKEVKKLFPESKEKDKMNPFEFLKKSYETFSKNSKGMSGFVALAIKAIMGDKPVYSDYKNAAVGINNWMNQSMTPQTYAYAEGGEVKLEEVISGEDYSGVIAKSLQDSVAPEIDKTIQDLMKQLMLKPSEVEKKEPRENERELDNIESDMYEEDGEFSSNAGDYKQLLDLIAGVESTSYGGYNAFNRGGSAGGTIAHGSGNATKDTIGGVVKPLTQRTVKEIMDLQNKGELHATGRYQIIRSTLKGLMNGNYGNTGVKLDDLYDSKTQDKLGISLIKYRLRTGATPQNFRREWIGLKNVSDSKLQAAIDKAKSGRIYSISGNASQAGLPALPPTGTMRGQNYGDLRKGGRRHAGQDYDIRGNQKFHSRIGGEVVHVGYNPGGYGNYVDIYNKNLNVTERIAEGANVLVSKGDNIKKGQAVVQGESNTGVIHYEIRKGKNRSYGFEGTIDPKKFLSTASASKFHGGIGFVSKDGLTLKLHKGEMYKVIDKDSVDLFGKDFIQDIIEIENKSQLVARAPAIIEKLKAISGYTDYEQSYAEPEVIFIPVPTPTSTESIQSLPKPSLSVGYSTIDTMGEQISDNLMYG